MDLKDWRDNDDTLLLILLDFGLLYLPGRYDILDVTLWAETGRAFAVFGKSRDDSSFFDDGFTDGIDDKGLGEEKDISVNFIVDTNLCIPDLIWNNHSHVLTINNFLLFTFKTLML